MGSLAVILRDGHLIEVFQLCQAPEVLFGGGGEAHETWLRNRNRVLQIWSRVGLCDICTICVVAGRWRWLKV